jgi:hypothetical protein
VDAAAPWAIIFLVNIYSTVLFHVDRYKKSDAAAREQNIYIRCAGNRHCPLPVVDKGLAALLADKKLGEKPALGSQVTLGAPTIQKVNDKLVWVVPLLHSGFFKWFF